MHLQRIWPLGFGVLALSACVEFKELSLYTGQEPAMEMGRPERVNELVEPVIYSDDPTDMWGLEETICKKAELTYDEVYAGLQAVKITWNRYTEGCEFAGIGIGWDAYAGKDLTGLMDYAAVEFYVKAQKERMFGLPIVLTLEDYSGGLGFAYTDNKYFERTFIDTNWQKVTVPLADFDLETENLDPSNIKQLQLELQQSGSIVIDEIKLVFYTPQPMEPWLEEEELPDPLKTPITIFSDDFINGNGWGMMTDACREVSLSSTYVYEGDKSLHLKWNQADDCKIMEVGASWNKWHPVDFSGNQTDFALSFFVYHPGKATSEINLYAGLEDYDRLRAEVLLKADYTEKAIFDNNWTEVTIPVSALEGAIDFSRVKQVLFRFDATGEIYIDNLRLIRLNDN